MGCLSLLLSQFLVLIIYIQFYIMLLKENSGHNAAVSSLYNILLYEYSMNVK